MNATQRGKSLPQMDQTSTTQWLRVISRHVAQQHSPIENSAAEAEAVHFQCGALGTSLPRSHKLDQRACSWRTLVPAQYAKSAIEFER